MAGTKKKIIQFDVLAFLEAQEVNLQDTLAVNMMNIAYFYLDILQKSTITTLLFPASRTFTAFLRIIFLQPPSSRKTCLVAYNF